MKRHEASGVIAAAHGCSSLLGCPRQSYMQGMPLHTKPPNRTRHVECGCNSIHGHLGVFSHSTHHPRLRLVMIVATPSSQLRRHSLIGAQIRAKVACSRPVSSIIVWCCTAAAGSNAAGPAGAGAAPPATPYAWKFDLSTPPKPDPKVQDIPIALIRR